MPQDNVELARRCYAALNERDWDAFLALMDREVEIESRLVVMEGGYQGHDGVRRWRNDFLSTFPDYQVEVEQVRDLGEVTLGRCRGRARSAGSETPLDDQFWQPIRWRDGKCVWWPNCPTEAEALEAAGLSE